MNKKVGTQNTTNADDTKEKENEDPTEQPALQSLFLSQHTHNTRAASGGGGGREGESAGTFPTEETPNKKRRFFGRLLAAAAAGEHKKEKEKGLRQHTLDHLASSLKLS